MQKSIRRRLLFKKDGTFKIQGKWNHEEFGGFNMPRTKQKMITRAAGLFVAFILIMTWFYPFSFFSMYKSYAFTPDPVVVDGYVNDLKAFKKSYQNDLNELTTDRNIDLTTDQTQHLLPLFEQDWLVSKERVNMSELDLGNNLFKVKTTRNTLLRLLAKEEYTQVQRQYLADCIESLLLLEEDIMDIKTGKAESRNTLRVQFSNLHGSYLNNFMLFNIFYESTRKA